MLTRLLIVLLVSTPALAQEGSGTTKRNGSVVITSLPAMCDVMFRGKTIKKTKPSLTIPDVPPGKHFIAFRRPGQTLMHKAIVASGKPTKLHVDFTLKTVTDLAKGAPPEAPPELSGASAMFAGRARHGRNGASGKTESAVLLGLKWLAKTQSADGSWASSDYGAKMDWVSPGVTALATLAFLGAGQTATKGEHARTIDKAIRHLIKIQDASGLVGGKEGNYIYNHAIATLALVEEYGLSKSDLTKEPARRAVKWLLQARNEGQAWRYKERDRKNDVSVTGWCVTALKAAKGAGVDAAGIDDAMLDAVRWINAMTDTSYWVTGYMSKPPRGWQQPTSSRFQNDKMGVNTANSHKPNHTPTAIAVVCRAFATNARRNSLGIKNGCNVLSQQMPSSDEGGGGKGSKIDYYYAYYGSLAMFQAGGKYWTLWNKELKTNLLPLQVRSGDEAGSWPADGAWGFAGGQVYSTAICVLTFQTYYRYPRVTRK